MLYEVITIQKISIAYKELIVNSLDHGCVDSNSLKATLDYQINCNKVILSVEDDGCGFDPEDIPDPTDLNRLEELLKNNKEEEYTRITSYNVCYTKLLRVDQLCSIHASLTVY